jgi:hypothetical protein
VIIYVLFAQRVEQHEGEHAPEAVEVVDEYALTDTTLETIENTVVGQWEEDFGPFEDTFVNRQWIEIRLGQVERELRDLLLNPQLPKLQGNAIVPKPSVGTHPSYSGITVQEGRTPGKIVDDEILD